MMSLFLISCDDRHPTPAQDVVSDGTEPFPDFNAMSKEELMEYFKDYEFGERGSPPVSFEITNREGLPVTPEIKTRNSLKCDVEMTVTSYSGSSTDSATLEVLENDVVIKSYKIFHTPKISLEIDDANEYKYKVTPLGDDSNPDFSLKVGLKYGSKWSFNINGVFTTQPFNYTCPEPTYGYCEVELCTRKLGGDATGYQIIIFEDDVPQPIKETEATSSSYFCVSLFIDDSKTYRFIVFPKDPGPNEGFNFTVSTPYLNYGYTFILNSGTPNYGEVDNFTYFDCP